MSARDLGTDARPAECVRAADCFRPDCVERVCVEGLCEEVAELVCEPSDACHELTGTCTPEGVCGERLIDADGDGHASAALGDCGSDCDDTDPGAFPDATERCDGRDEDCDGAIDEGVSTVCGRDEDGDGYGSAIDATRECGDVLCADGYVPNADDCWDGPTDGIMPGEPNPVLANPDQRNFFIFPREDDGSFDWDCDGRLTKNFDDEIFVGCEGFEMGGGECVAQSGWETEPPECGERGARVACLIGPASACTVSVGMGTRGCR